MTSIQRAALTAALLLGAAPLLAACSKAPPAAVETCQGADVKKEITALEAKLEKLQGEIGDLQTNYENANDFLAQPNLSPADKKEGETQLATLGKQIDANGKATQETQARLDKLKALKPC